MTLGYGWLTKTQKRIADALVSGKLTKWEMQFIQTIDAKLETYQTDSKLSKNQHEKLFTLLTKAETPTTRQPHSSSSSPFSFDHQRPHRAGHHSYASVADTDGHMPSLLLDMSDFDSDDQEPLATTDFQGAFDEP
jgi:hypothetical protein